MKTMENRRLGPVALVLLCLLVMAAHARVARFSDWATANNLGSPLNTPGVEMDSFLSRDGLSLYFVAGRARGGFGGRDIWVSRRRAIDRAWEAPQNLGPNVNSPFNENAPKLSPDGRTMYFQSDRPGFGGNDLYVSSRHRRRDDSGWEAAANLGRSGSTLPPMKRLPSPWEAGRPHALVFCVRPGRRAGRQRHLRRETGGGRGP